MPNSLTFPSSPGCWPPHECHSWAKPMATKHFRKGPKHRVSRIEEKVEKKIKQHIPGFSTQQYVLMASYLSLRFDGRMTTTMLVSGRTTSLSVRMNVLVLSSGRATLQQIQSAVLLLLQLLQQPMTCCDRPNLPYYYYNYYNNQ